MQEGKSVPNSWNKFEGNEAAVHFPAGLAAGPCLYQLLPGSNNKRRGDGVWLRYSGRTVRPCHAWRRKEQQFIAASKLFNATFIPSSVDCALSDICKITKIDFMAETECVVSSSSVFLCFGGFFRQ